MAVGIRAPGIDKRDFAQPLWLGESDIAGKTILLHEEQVLAITIQFCRYATLGGTTRCALILEVPRALHELMRTLPGVAHVVSKGDPLPDFEVYCPLLTLPLAFRTRLETIPSATRYLHASSRPSCIGARKWGWRRKSVRGLGLPVGQPDQQERPKRSITLAALSSLLDVDATFVSLQKEVRPDDAEMLTERGGLLHFGNELKDFSDTAALIANLDLVISVDTSVAHLAGALESRSGVAAHVPDWRWLIDRDDSPWYPTARLFRQDDTRTWDGVHRARSCCAAAVCEPRIVGWVELLRNPSLRAWRWVRKRSTHPTVPARRQRQWEAHVRRPAGALWIPR